MKRLGLAFLCLLLCGATEWPPFTPTSTADLIDKTGIQAASRILSEHDDAGWNLVLDGIATGAPAWLALIPRLKQAGSASVLESLPISLSLALQHRPAEVLRLLPARYPIGRICADTEIEPTRGQLSAFYRHAIRAVRAVRAPDLRPARNACLASLAAAAHAARISPH